MRCHSGKECNLKLWFVQRWCSPFSPPCQMLAEEYSDSCEKVLLVLFKDVCTKVLYLFACLYVVNLALALPTRSEALVNRGKDKFSKITCYSYLFTLLQENIKHGNFPPLCNVLTYTYYFCTWTTHRLKLIYNVLGMTMSSVQILLYF